jgi:cyclophilin family peptidyl-prolyl cis-trans isomerase
VSLRTFTAGLSVALISIIATPVAAQDTPPNPRVLVETNQGDFEIELFKDQVPATVVNFLMYVQAGYYEGTVFHRIIRDMIVQGGGLVTGEDNQVIPKVDGLRGQILNEASNNLKNSRGTVSMARNAAPNTARSQFFINLDNNVSFNHKNDTPQGFGYAVFGRITDGMNTVRRMGNVRTGNQGDLRDVPLSPIVILSITQVATQ